MFKGFTWKDWVIGYFTFGLWIVWKLHKNGVPVGKIVGGLFVFFLIVGIVTPKKDAKAENTNTTTEKVEVSKVSEVKATNEKVETETLKHSDFKLGMDVKDLPSNIKLVKGDKMRDYDKSFKYSDGNQNKVKIGKFEGDISFVISELNNKVRSITFDIKNTKNVSEDDLKELANLFTNDILKKRTINNFTNGKLGVIILERESIKNGINYDFKIMYTNENSIYPKPNSIMIINDYTDEQKEKSETNKIIEKTVEDSFLTIKEGSFLCPSLNDYQRLIDYANNKPNTSQPSECFKTKEGKFSKTSSIEYYDGNKIIKVMGGGNKYHWVLESFIK